MEWRFQKLTGVYAQKAFIGTVYSKSKETKETWLSCQGYSYGKSPESFASVVFARRRAETRKSWECTLFGKVAAEVFSCKKHPLDRVPLRIALVKSKPEFSMTHDGVAKIYKNTKSQANNYVREPTFSDNVFTAIEKTLKKPSFSRYTGFVPST